MKEQDSWLGVIYLCFVSTRPADLIVSSPFVKLLVWVDQPAWLSRVDFRRAQIYTVLDGLLVLQSINCLSVTQSFMAGRYLNTAHKLYKPPLRYEDLGPNEENSSCSFVTQHTVIMTAIYQEERRTSHWNGMTNEQKTRLHTV